LLVEGAGNADIDIGHGDFLLSCNCFAFR